MINMIGSNKSFEVLSEVGSTFFDEKNNGRGNKL